MPSQSSKLLACLIKGRSRLPQNHQNFPFLCFMGLLMGASWLFPESVGADPFVAVAEKIKSTTTGLLKIGAVGCGLVGALLIIQGIFGRLNLKWGVSFVIGAILLASFEYVITFITQS